MCGTSTLGSEPLACLPSDVQRKVLRYLRVRTSAFAHAWTFVLVPVLVPVHMPLPRSVSTGVHTSYGPITEAVRLL